VLASTGCQRAGGPNILLYVVDTLRADAVGAYGDTAMHTPAADRLAAEGIRFARAYANASWTRPSMATLLTGTYPRTHGAIGRQDALRSGLPTLATELRARGYHTAAVFANPNVGAAFGFAEGFDDFIPLYPPRLGHGQTLPQEQIGTAVNVVNRAIDWLRAHRRQPFFLLVFSVDPHAPYEPPPPYNTMYDAEYTGHIDGSMESVFALLAGAAMGTPPPARDVQHLRALYHGEVTFNDAHLARLLGELDDQHLTDNTLVVFTSDHGEEFYEHGHGDHGHSLYEELIHIPLIMRWPRVTARGTVYPDAVQLADLTLGARRQGPRLGLDRLEQRRRARRQRPVAGVRRGEIGPARFAGADFGSAQIDLRCGAGAAAGLRPGARPRRVAALARNAAARSHNAHRRHTGAQPPAAGRRGARGAADRIARSRTAGDGSVGVR